MLPSPNCLPDHAIDPTAVLILARHDLEPQLLLERTGDCAAFAANTPDGHHFLNRSTSPASFLVIGSKAPREVVTYSDVDLVVTMAEGRADFSYKDGSSYAGPR